MPWDIVMPQMTDAMTHGRVVRWFKREGQFVRPGDVLAELDTAVGPLELESFDEGPIARIYVRDGQTAKVGALLALGAFPTEPLAAIRGSAVVPAAAPAAPARPAAPSKSVRRKRRLLNHLLRRGHLP